MGTGVPQSEAGDFVPSPRFEDYREKYKEHVAMERRDGVIMLRMHTQNKPVVWSAQSHRVIHQAIKEAGDDPENHVMILTGTGDFWVAYGVVHDKDSAFHDETAKEKSDVSWNYFVGDAVPLQENLLFDVRIPTIAAINGTGFHMDMALMCDLVICTPDTQMIDIHTWLGLVSGDGVNVAYQEYMGTRRANWAMLMGDPVSAQQALEWGVVNELVDRERLYDRAWEIGARINRNGEGGRVWRRFMTEIMRKPIKTRMTQDFFGGFAAEMYGYMADSATTHDYEVLDEVWKQYGVEIPKW